MPGHGVTALPQHPRGGPPSRTRALLAPLGLVALILAANALPLLGIVDTNPVDTLSGLGRTTSGQLLPGLSYLDPNVGITTQALGHLAARDILAGHLPWWNPYEGTGAPLAAEMNSAALFPPTVLLAWSAGLAWEHALLEVSAALATYALTRTVGAGRLAAWVGGAVFGLAGTFAWLFHAPGNSVAFLPLALLGIERARARAVDGAWSRGWVVVAVAIGLSWYAGFPEATAIDGMLIACWTLVRTVGLPGPGRLRLLAAAAAGAVGGTALAAPLLVPFAEYLRVADLGSHGGGLGHQHLPGASWPGLLLPYVFGPLFGWLQPTSTPIAGMWAATGGYLSGVLAAVAAVGAVGRRLRSLRLVLAGWVLLCCVRIYGFQPAVALVSTVPGMGSVQFSRFCPTSVELAAAVLAALAVDDLSAGHAARRLTVLAVGTVGTAVMAAAAVEANHVLSLVRHAPHLRGWEVSSVAWGAAGMLVALGAVALRRRWSPALVAAVVAVDAFSLFVTPELSAPRSVTIDAAPVAFLRSHVGDGRIFTIGLLQPDYGSYYGLGQADVSDTPLPAAYATWVTSRLNTNVDPVIFTGFALHDPSGPSYADELAANLANYQATGVAYLVVPRLMPLPQPPLAVLRQVWADQQVAIYALPHPAPVVTAPGCAVTSSDPGVAEVRCGAPSQLRRLVTNLPGWQATVEGRPTAIHEVDGLFQSVDLPAGTSSVRWRYRPNRLGQALALAGLSGAAICAELVSRPLGRPLGRRRSPAGRHGRPID